MAGPHDVSLPIYMDHNATTPTDPRVFEAMRPYFTEVFGNAASRGHSFGWAAEAAVDKARQQVAALFNARADAIVWTSGATESNNLALKGVAGARARKSRHLITQVTEHKAVLDCCKRLEKEGCRITWLGVDARGRIDLDELRDAISQDTVLVSIMWANNEVGTIQPIEAIARVVREKGPRSCLFAVDAIAAAAWLAIDVVALDVDLLALAGHKVDGPKGTGALYLKKGTHILAQQQGGAQERYRRAGTEDIAGAVGFSVAFELAATERETTARRVKRLRDRLRSAVLAAEAVELTGHPRDRLPNLVSIVVGEADGASMVMKLDLEGVAASVGSACTTGSTEPSHVLTAMGYPEDEARGSLRLSLGRTTTDAEIDQAVEIVPRVIADSRSAAAVLAADPLGQAVAT